MHKRKAETGMSDRSELSAGLDTVAANDPPHPESPPPVIPELPLETLAEQNFVPNGEHPYYIHRAMICLDSQGHSSGVEMRFVCLKNEQRFLVTWNDSIDNKIRDSIQDLIAAAEHSALAFAFLLAEECTGYQFKIQAKRNTAFDYYISKDNGDDRNIFNPENTARLEVTGILNGDVNEINARFSSKFKRSEKYDQYRRMPIYVCVVEHSAPYVELRKRDAKRP